MVLHVLLSKSVWQMSKLCIISFNLHKISLNHPGLILLLKSDISMQGIHWLQLTHFNCVFIPNLSPFGTEPHSFLTTITIKQNYCYMCSSPHIYTCMSFISQTGIVHKLFFGFSLVFTMCFLFHFFVNIQLRSFMLKLILSTPGPFSWRLKKSHILFDL